MGKRTWLGMVLGLVFAAGALPGIGIAAITTGYTSAGGFPVAAGVDYDFGSVVVDGSIRRSVNIVEVDPTESLIGIQLALANGIASGKATTLEQALTNSTDGHRVVATTNGSLFSYVRRDNIVVAEMGLGFNVSDGELINAGSPLQRPDLPAFALDQDGAPMIGTPHLVANLTLPGGEPVAIDRINQVRADTTVVLYTPRLGSHTWTDNLGDEYVIEGFDLPLQPTGTHTGTVVAVQQGVGDSPIGPGQVVLSVSDTAAPWATTLAVGNEVTMSLTVDDGWGAVSQSVGGRDMLVVDGQDVTPLPDVDGSHTRTAIGIDAAGKIILVAVDNASSSKGLRLPETANLMISLGAVDAMNLDGGNSTQMVVRHPGDVDASLVTAPEVGGIYRQVANTLQIVSYAPDGPLDRLILTPDHATAAVGEQVDFTAKGQDAALNGFELDTSALQWSVDAVGQGDAPPFTSQDSFLSVTANQPGDYLVTVRYESFEASAPLTVTPDQTAPVVSVPEVSMLEAGAVGRDWATLGVGWTATDNVNVARVQVQRRVGSGPWTDVAHSGPSAVSTTSVAAFGRRVQFRVRATDGAENTSAWTLSESVRVLLFDDNNKRVSATGMWTRKSTASAIGGKYMRSKTPGGSRSIDVRAMQIALIANRGPMHGQADVYLNGSPVASVSLYASATEARRLIFLSTLLDDPARTVVRLANVSPGAQKTVDVDAFLALVLD